MIANRITSLRELAQDISPSRDLWQDIEREIGAPASTRGRATRHAWLSGIAVAATIAAVAFGVWIGRAQFSPSPLTRLDQVRPVNVGLVTDPRYLGARAALLKSLQQKLDALPPESQKKVAASIVTLHKAKRDLEDALGKDPGNALLQELLVNTYQDEMRVLTTVHEAGAAGGGI